MSTQKDQDIEKIDVYVGSRNFDGDEEKSTGKTIHENF
jgi:hypothetical protein